MFKTLNKHRTFLHILCSSLASRLSSDIISTRLSGARLNVCIPCMSNNSPVMSTTSFLWNRLKGPKGS
ncbi:hypothetical protein EYF80_030989 [Liparis tanakae]|uniref:Uncharacterized protein n=1 Tax=Liparis tanakae TaxID=230148 RepID=A0A4Z2H020_9TELE|nr:hypothetical protein EYF80_030989 [Liparis tanakae]